ncbi:MAG: hypothetical protein WBV36_23010 [Terriglobales bacterium]
MTTLTDMRTEDAENVSSACGPLGHEANKELFRLIEVAEPALLLCRDALAATRANGGELRAIQASLKHIAELKSNRLQVPVHP